MCTLLYFCTFSAFCCTHAVKVGLSHDVVARKSVKKAQVPDLPVLISVYAIFNNYGEATFAKRNLVRGKGKGKEEGPEQEEKGSPLFPPLLVPTACSSNGDPDMETLLFHG